MKLHANAALSMKEGWLSRGAVGRGSWAAGLSWVWSWAQLSIASLGEDRVLLGHRSGGASQSGPSMRPERSWRLPERRVGCG
jgi:hypothetical protein